MSNRTLINIALIIFIFLTLQLIFTHLPDYPLTKDFWKIDFTALSDYGTVVAGLLGLLSAYFIFRQLEQQNDSLAIQTNSLTRQTEAIKLQADAIKLQSDTFYVTQFENRVFELIRYHRENVTNMHMKAPSSTNGITYNGHKALREIHKQVIEVCNFSANYFENVKSTDLFVSSSARKNEQRVKRETRIEKLSTFSWLNVSYLIVFYGVSEEGKHSLFQILDKKYKRKFTQPIIDGLSIKIAKWDREDQEHIRKADEDKECTPDKRDKTVYYGGHQYRLGHYFRHLFQTVSYIDNNTFIDYDEKYDYVKILRAQLSTYEQTLLFFNSISDMGNAWELKVSTNHFKDNNPQSDIDIYVKGKKLITKYDLVRNIPEKFINGLKVNDVYPHITFIDSAESRERRELNLIFRKGLPKLKYNT